VLTWADASLTQQGIDEANGLGAFWADEMQASKIPLPEKFFVSPLTRCLETAEHTFGSLKLADGQEFQPVVKEALREIHGVHTCDRRRDKTWMASKFPNDIIEPGFSESDEHWKADKRETTKRSLELNASYKSCSRPPMRPSSQPLRTLEPSEPCTRPSHILMFGWELVLSFRFLYVLSKKQPLSDGQHSRLTALRACVDGRLAKGQWP
jgi:hypothetical protein